MFAEGFPADVDPLIRLETFFRARACLLGAQASMGRLMFSEQLIHAAGEAGREKLVAWRRRNLAFVVSCLQELQDAGQLPPGLEVSSLRVIVQGALLSFAFERLLNDHDSPDLERHVESCWQTLSSLLVPPPRDLASPS